MRTLVVIVSIMAFTNVVRADLPSAELLLAQVHVESNDDDNAVGDTHLQHKAYGCLQIRKPCVDDYNRWHKTNYKAEDCLGNRELSVKIYRSYIDNYATEARLGRKPTSEDMARIWNGGPNGWKKDNTKPYWEKVKVQLK